MAHGDRALVAHEKYFIISCGIDKKGVLRDEIRESFVLCGSGRDGMCLF